MKRILYLAHDLDDAAIWRRVSMLETGGAEVKIAGFRRDIKPLNRDAIVLGRTHNRRFLHRALTSLLVHSRGRQLARDLAPDIILARNLEMLPLARSIKMHSGPEKEPKIYYEVLDVHRLMLGKGYVASLLRLIERKLCENVENVLISSMRFDVEYFKRYRQISSRPILIENKVWQWPEPSRERPVRRVATESRQPIVIGWFGILRCAASMKCLDEATRSFEGRVRLMLRGKPALDAIPNFFELVRDNPYIEFQGPYNYPDDLARIYNEIDIAWLVDRYDADANSDWLLPNRLYESCAHGAIPLALEGTETGRFLQRKDIGLVLSELRPGEIASVIGEIDRDLLSALRAKLDSMDPSAWWMTRQDCAALVRLLGDRAQKRATGSPLPPFQSTDLAR